MKTLLLIGGGHSHVEVLRRFGAEPANNVRVALVSPTAHTAYSGMLPGLIAGHYDFHQCHIDLPALVRRAGGEFLETGVTAINTAARTVSCANGATLAYDVASLDIGSTPSVAGIKGAAEHTVPVKPTHLFLAKWDQLLERVRRNALAKSFRIIVVGGGAAGVEVLLAMQHRLRSLGCQHGHYAIVTDTDTILPGHGAKVRATFEQVLRARNVNVRCNTSIAEVNSEAVITASGEAIAADQVIWATGASPAAWPAGSGLSVDARGFIRVRDTLELIDRPGVFAAGDIASVDHHPRPKSGVYAVRQGPPLADNLRRALGGLVLRPFRPQRQALALISTGNRYAIASRGWLFVRGHWVWYWKDHIDRKFMRRYQSE